MYEFNEQALRRGINMGLGSQGIWTPELEDIMFNEITNEALRIHNVSDWLDENTNNCGCEPETCKMLKGKCKNLAYR